MMLARIVGRVTAAAATTMPQTRNQIMATVARVMSTKEFAVKHDPVQHQFVIQLDQDNQALLKYMIKANKEVELYHTEVPKLYGGKGIGNILAKEAFNHFEKTGQKMILTCPFLIKVNKTKT